MELLILIISFLPFLAQGIFKKFIYFGLLGVISVGIHGTYLFGPEILILLAITYVISTIAELVSLKTSLYCFGVRYWYNLKHSFFSSRINLLGVYPLEVTFAWVLLKYISFCLGILISNAFGLSKWSEILLIPFILVSTDFIIDPVSVNKNKLWRWEKGGFYFGIPWQNFLGWYIVGLVSTMIFNLVNFSGTVSFNSLFLLPIFFYATILQRFPALYKQNKKLAIIGSLPVFIWVMLSLFSLYILYLRSVFV